MSLLRYALLLFKIVLSIWILQYYEEWFIPRKKSIKNTLNVIGNNWLTINGEFCLHHTDGVANSLKPVLPINKYFLLLKLLKWNDE